jgi:hypothetical protein
MTVLGDPYVINADLAAALSHGEFRELSRL